MPVERSKPNEGFGPILRLAAGPPVDARGGNSLPHVLFVLDGFPKTLGGGERIVLRLAALLPLYGYRASILTLAMHPESEFKPEDAPCPVFLLPLRKTYDRAAWRGALALRELIRSERIGIVQTFFESSDLWAGVVTRVLTPARLIWSRRDMGILRGNKHAAAYRALRRLPQAVFAVSEEVRQHAIRVDGIPPERTYTIYNGLELASVDRPPGMRDAGPFVVTTVGNIRRVKGHDLFLRAAAEVLHAFPETQFSIAGEVLEADYLQELHELVSSLGLTSRVRFTGRISDLPSHLQQADIFVLPSRSEGFSSALVEAMANGVPVVATDVGGNSEAVEHNVSGLIVKSEDPVALADAIVQLLGSPALAERLAMAAREKVSIDFTTEAMMRKTTNVYNALQRAR